MNHLKLISFLCVLLFVASASVGAVTVMTTSSLESAVSDSQPRSLDTVWNETYGGDGYDFGFSITTAEGGGFVLAGMSDSSLTSAGGFDALLVMVNRSGSVGWTLDEGGSDTDSVDDIVRFDTDDYVLAGRTKSFGSGSSDVWFLWTSTTSGGDPYVRINETFGGSGFEDGQSIVYTDDRNFAIAGVTDSYGAGGNDAWLLKIDTSGDELWNRTYGGSGDDVAASHRQLSTGDFVIVGSTDSFRAGGDDAWLIKTDETGTERWNRTYGGSNQDQANAVVPTQDGGFILVGETNSFSGSDTDAWTVRVNASGDHVWNRTSGGDNPDRWHSIERTNDGNYVLVGETASKDGTDDDVWIKKIRENGTELWSRVVGGANDDAGWDVVQQPDGRYGVIGETSSFETELSDYWAAELSPIYPRANFESNKTSPVVNETIEFNATASFDPDGSVTRYRWDFDDDGSYEASGRTALTSFSTTGTKTVRLEITDDNGGSNWTYREINISAKSTKTPDTLIVAPDGTGDYTRIQNAINNSTPGDTVLVRDGTYEEELVVSKNITLKTNESATLQGISFTQPPEDADYPSVYCTNRICSRGIEIPNGSGAAPTIMGFRIESYSHGISADDTSSSWNITDVTIVKSNKTAVSADGSSGNWTIENSRIIENRDSVHAFRSTGGWTIHDTVIRWNYQAIDAYESAGDWTISYSIIEDNVFPGTTSSSSTIRAEGSAGSWTIVETQVTNNSAIGIGAQNTTGNWTLLLAKVTEANIGIDLRKAAPGFDIERPILFDNEQNYAWDNVTIVANRSAIDVNRSIDFSVVDSETGDPVRRGTVRAQGDVYEADSNGTVAVRFNEVGTYEVNGSRYNTSISELQDTVTVSVSREDVSLVLDANRTAPRVGETVQFSVVRADNHEPTNASLQIRGTELATGRDGVLNHSYRVAGSDYVIASKSDTQTESFFSDSASISVSHKQAELNLTSNRTSLSAGESVLLIANRSDKNEFVNGTISINNTAHEVGSDGKLVYTFDNAGTFNVTLSKSNTSSTTFKNDGQTISVAEPPTVEISVTNTTINTTTVTVGRTVNISAAVENVDPVTGSANVSLTVNDSIVQNKTVDLGPNSTTTVYFEHTFDEVGEFEVIVNEVPAGNVTVTPPGDPPSLRTSLLTSINNVDAPIHIRVNASDPDGVVETVNVSIGDGPPATSHQCGTASCNLTVAPRPRSSSWTGEGYDPVEITVAAVDDNRSRTTVELFTTVHIAGDANGDGHVDIFDLVALGRHWKTSRGETGFADAADLNNDGEVDILDAAIIGQQWSDEAE